MVSKLGRLKRHASHLEWSRLRNTLRDLFAPSLAKRLDIHLAVYDKPRSMWTHAHSRGFVTWDGIEILNMADAIEGQTFHAELRRLRGLPPGPRIPYTDEEETLLVALLRSRGIYSGLEFHGALQDYVHCSLTDNLTSGNDIRRAFCMVDRRTGKRRLSQVDPDNEPPLVAKFYRLRVDADSEH